MWKNKRIAGVPISTDSFRSIKQAMKDISRNDYADDDTILHRLRICRSCPHFGSGPKKGTSNSLSETKLKLKNSTCPLRKWSLSSDSRIDSSDHQDTTEESNKEV